MCTYILVLFFKVVLNGIAVRNLLLFCVPLSSWLSYNHGVCKEPSGESYVSPLEELSIVI